MLDKTIQWLFPNDLLPFLPLEQLVEQLVVSTKDSQPCRLAGVRIISRPF